APNWDTLKPAHGNDCFKPQSRLPSELNSKVLAPSFGSYKHHLIPFNTLVDFKDLLYLFNPNQQPNRRQEATRVYVAARAENRGYAGNLPKCNRCNLHHNGQCPPKCQRCQRTKNREKDCRVGLPSADVTPIQDVVCFSCAERGHYKNKCPKARNLQKERTRMRAYVVVENPQQNLNVVTGMFLLNDLYACILFDSGAEKSFVSSAFTPYIDIALAAFNTTYEVELADGMVVSTNPVLQKDPRLLSCIKADEKKPKDTPIVCDFPEVFLDDLS
nr:hypothetical protein [Tanacetum cinerariifolium]